MDLGKDCRKTSHKHTHKPCGKPSSEGYSNANIAAKGMPMSYKILWIKNSTSLKYICVLRQASKNF